MKKYLTIAVIAAWTIFAGLAQATEATVTAIKGTATFKVGGGAAQPIAVGTKLPQGAEISTQANSQVTIQAHDGIVAIAGQNTDITVENLSVSGNGVRNATIDLKKGNLASSLDPAKRSQNNYSVRTPKGVAAARGTTYSVAYDGVIYSVTVVAGVVQSFSATGMSVNVQVGQVSSYSDAAGPGAVTTTLAEAITNNPSMGDGLSLLASAVASVSTNVVDVAAVINTIASNAGTGQNATNAVASATAAATATAASNPNIGGASGVAATASAIVGAAVNGAAAAGNAAAAGTIVATTTVAVATSTGAPVQGLATTLAEVANNTAGVSVNATAVANAATASIQSGNQAVTTTAIVETQTTTSAGTEVNIVEAPVTTPITPVNPDISASPAGS